MNFSRLAPGLFAKTAILSCALLFAAQHAQAADQQGQFSIKGGGLQTCEAFLGVMEDGGRDIAAYGGWIEGYLTGQNQRLDNTYDAASWANTSTLLTITRSICAQMEPDKRFIDAFDVVIRMILPSRLQSLSPVVSLREDTQVLVIYRDVLVLVRNRLAALGYTVDPEAGNVFGTETRAALRSFQADKDLETTGFPDQRTLLYLFVPAAQPKK